jgi:hypothetical protein
MTNKPDKTKRACRKSSDGLIKILQDAVEYAKDARRVARGQAPFTEEERDQYIAYLKGCRDKTVAARLSIDQDPMVIEVTGGWTPG